jgi:hypothetical protein
VHAVEEHVGHPECGRIDQERDDQTDEHGESLSGCEPAREARGAQTRWVSRW